MKSFFLFILVVCTVQIQSEDLQRDVSMEKIINLQFEARQINKDYKQYKENILENVRQTYSEFEASILQKYNDYVSGNKKINETLLAICNRTYNFQLPIIKENIDNYKACITKAEINYYRLPLDDYEYLLYSMSEKLENIVHEIINECNYWKQNKGLILSSNECFELKKPGFYIIYHGLTKISMNLRNLIYESVNKLKLKAQQCSVKEALKLDEKFVKIQEKINFCFNHA